MTVEFRAMTFPALKDGYSILYTYHVNFLSYRFHIPTELIVFNQNGFGLLVFRRALSHSVTIISGHNQNTRQAWCGVRGVASAVCRPTQAAADVQVDWLCGGGAETCVESFALVLERAPGLRGVLRAGTEYHSSSISAVRTGHRDNLCMKLLTQQDGPFWGFASSVMSEREHCDWRGVTWRAFRLPLL